MGLKNKDHLQKMVNEVRTLAGTIRTVPHDASKAEREIAESNQEELRSACLNLAWYLVGQNYEEFCKLMDIEVLPD